MAVLAPTLNTSTPGVVTSAFSGNGVMSPTATVAAGINPNNPISYNNSVSSPFYSQTITPTQQGGGPTSGLLSNASTIKSAGQFVGNGFQLPQSQFINGIGTQLGFAPSAVTYGTQFGPLTAAQSATGGTLGPAMAPQAVGTAGTLSSALGAAGIGAFAGNFLGKIGGNSTGGSVGGGVGAGIGMAVGGPIGAVVGGLIGGIGGGFFGNGKKPTATYVEQYRLDGDQVTQGDTSQKNGDSVKGPVQNFSQQTTDAYTKARDYLKPLGISLDSNGYQTGINTQNKQYGLDTTGWLQSYDYAGKTIGTYGWTPGDVKSQQQAILQSLTASATTAGATKEQVAEMLNTIFKDPASASTPLIPNKKETTNTAWSDFITGYQNSIKPQGTNNATTNTTTSSVPTV